jgi:hypothetical protein
MSSHHTEAKVQADAHATNASFSHEAAFTPLSQAAPAQQLSWIEGMPPEEIDLAWLHTISCGPDGDVAIVVLAVLIPDLGWAEAGDWKGESYKDQILEEITHWMPYMVPSANLNMAK